MLIVPPGWWYRLSAIAPQFALMCFQNCPIIIFEPFHWTFQLSNPKLFNSQSFEHCRLLPCLRAVVSWVGRVVAKETLFALQMQGLKREDGHWALREMLPDPSGTSHTLDQPLGQIEALKFVMEASHRNMWPVLASWILLGDRVVEFLPHGPIQPRAVFLEPHKLWVRLIEEVRARVGALGTCSCPMEKCLVDEDEFKTDPEIGWDALIGTLTRNLKECLHYV